MCSELAALCYVWAHSWHTLIEKHFLWISVSLIFFFFLMNLSILKRLLISAWCTDVNKRGDDDVTPLHHAARSRREKNKKKETPSEPNPDEVCRSNHWGCNKPYSVHVYVLNFKSWAILGLGFILSSTGDSAMLNMESPSRMCGNWLIPQCRGSFCHSIKLPA